MFNPYAQFKKLYTKSIFWETVIVLIHICRKTIFNVRSSMDESVEGNSGSLLMILCVMLNLYFVYKNRNYLKYSLRDSKSFLFFILIGISSVLWTPVSDFKGIIAKAVELLSSYLLLSIILYKINDVWRCLYYIVFIATCAAFLGGIYVNFGHTNTYSVSALIGAILAIGLYKNYKIKTMKYYFVFNIAILIVGTSSASYISFIFAMVVLLSTSRKGINIPLLIVAFLFLFLTYKFAMPYISQYIFYGHTEEQIASGTGREFIWDIVFRAFAERPFLGYGFVLGERWVFANIGNIFILSAHNGYFSVLLGTGILGMLFFGFYMLKTLFQGYILTKGKTYSGYSAILLSALLGVLANNMSYPCIGSDWNHPFPAIILMMLLINTMRYKQVDMRIGKYIQNL